MPTPHKHAELIKAWADGFEIQVMTNIGWSDVGRAPAWSDSNEYRIKPAAPKWPQTTMTDEQIMIAMDYSSKSDGGPWRRIANQAIAHACESGALVPADKVREISAEAYAQGMLEERKAIREIIDAAHGYFDGTNKIFAALENIITRVAIK